MTTSTTTTIKNQTFGVEIELTGITRKTAAKVVANYFGTEREDLGTYYKAWGAKDSQGRTWKFMSDSSIYKINKFGNPTDNMEYSTEFVTPILRYEDMNTLREIMNLLVAKGAIANKSTGIHVHVGADAHTAKTLATLLKLAVSREGLLYEALGISHTREFKWCKKINKKLAEKAEKANTLHELETVWYSDVNEGGCNYISHDHYNYTRYHGVNLHSFVTNKGVEFRYFNGTTDADKIEAYIQLCLGINAYAINNPDAKISEIRKCETNRQKYDRMWKFLFDMQMPTKSFRNLHKQLSAVWAQ